jgi:hypothetical protein
MKLHFFYQWNYHEPVYGHPPYLVVRIILQDAAESAIQLFGKYLLSAIMDDYPEFDPEDCDDVLHDIKRLENGEISSCLAGTPDHFMHSLTATRVTFEHSIFGECPDWPIWACTLAQYKAALEGWRRFIDMPKSIDSELIIDMPDCVPGSEYGIQPAGSSQ